MALLGAILPAWGYHRDPADFTAVGNYFLSLAAGIVAAVALARPIRERKGLSFLLVFACALASVALVYLALVSPPLSEWWRVGGLLVLGISAGMLNVACFMPFRPATRARRRRPSTGAASGTDWGAFWQPCWCAVLHGAGNSAAHGGRAGDFCGGLQPEHLPFPARADTTNPAAGPPGLPKPGRGSVRAAPVLPVRQRMVDRRMAAPVPDPACGAESQSGAANPGAVLAVPDGREAGGGGHPAACTARPPAVGERAGGAVRLPHPLFDE